MAKPWPGSYYAKADPVPREELDKVYGGVDAFTAETLAMIKANMAMAKAKARAKPGKKPVEPEDDGGPFGEALGGEAAAEGEQRLGDVFSEAKITRGLGEKGGQFVSKGDRGSASAKARNAARDRVIAERGSQAEAKSDAKAPEPLQGVKPGSHPAKVSPSVTKTLKRTLNHEQTYIATGLRQMSADPDIFTHNMGLFKNADMYPSLRPEEVEGTPAQIAASVKRHIKANLRFLFDKADDIEKLGIGWYVGAHNIIKNMATKHNLPIQSVAAVYASLSPQKDWDQNIHLGTVLTDIYMTKQDHRWDAGMSKTIQDINEEKAKRKEKPLWTADEMAEIEGKTLGELEHADQKARWIRAYDQTYNYIEEPIRSGPNKGQLKRYRAYKAFQPDGTLSEDWVRTGSGSPEKVAWGTNEFATAAVQALESGGDRTTISRALPQKHKVRHFYNNLLDPLGLDGDVTIDTHAIGAAWMRQITGADAPVIQGLASSPDKAKYPAGWVPSKNSAENGAYGLYGLYADAYREVAADLGILPSDLQAVVWVVKRNKFVDALRDSDIAAIDALWDTYREGGATLTQTQEAVWAVTEAGRAAREVRLAAAAAKAAKKAKP